MLNKFQSLLASNDLARKNRYRISIAPPTELGTFSNDIAMMCESIEFPGRNFISQPDQLRYGPPREMATGVTYAPITATFICRSDMFEKRFFEIWQSLAVDMKTWEPNFYNNYTGGMKIYQLDKANNVTYVVSLFEVYPKTITAQDLGYATNDAYHTIAVELIYHHWVWANQATSPRRRATSRSISGHDPAVDTFADIPGEDQGTVAIADTNVVEGESDANG